MKVLTEVEMRKAKQELHKVITDTILAQGGMDEDDKQLYKYVIELCLNELTKEG